VKKYLKDALVS